MGSEHEEEQAELQHLRAEVARMREREHFWREAEARHATFLQAAAECAWRYEHEQPIPVHLPVEEQIGLIYRFAFLAEGDETFARAYGFAGADEIIGRRLEELFPPTPEHLAFLRTFIENGYCQTETELRQESGGQTRFSLNTTVGIVEDGHFVRSWGLQRDITALKRAELVAQGQAHALARSLQLLTTEPDLDRFLGQVLQTISESLNAPAASLWFYDSDTQVATLHGHCDNGVVLGTDALDELLPRHASAHHFPYLLRLERDRRPFVLNDIANTPLLGDERNRRWMLERGARAYLKVPLLLEGRFIGCVAIQNNERDTFAPEEIELAEALGVQVSLAVQLTRLAEATRQAAVAREQEQAATQRAVELAHANQALHAENEERRHAELLAQGQMSALLKTFARLSENPSLDNFVASVMRATIEQLGQDSGGLWLWDEAVQTTVLAVDYEDGEVKQGLKIARPGGPHDVRRAWDDKYLGRLRAREVLVQDVEAEWEASPHNAVRGIRTRLVLPLFFADEFLGSLTLRSRSRRTYTPGEIELARALASQVALAVQLTHLAAGARDAAVLEERTRIARDIHDTLAQTFTGIVVHLEAATVVAQGQARDLIAQARDLAREGASEARRGLHALRPQALEESDLARALHSLAERLGRGTSTRMACRIVGTPRSLPPHAEDNLLRVAQEALTNALRHAEPSEIEMALTFEPKRVHLSVRDNGHGFDPAQEKGDGLGLVGMRERMAEIEGEFILKSAPGAGTHIRAAIQTLLTIGTTERAATHL
jgi:signal transduction histidine kinase